MLFILLFSKFRFVLSNNNMSYLHYLSFLSYAYMISFLYLQILYFYNNDLDILHRIKKAKNR